MTGKMCGNLMWMKGGEGKVVEMKSGLNCNIYICYKPFDVWTFGLPALLNTQRANLVTY